MHTCVSDAALFYKRLGSEHIGTAYVDDTLHAGTKYYSKLCEETEKKFNCKKREWDNIQLSGLEIETHMDENKTHQNSYISKIQPLRADSNYAAFRSLRAKLS